MLAEIFGAVIIMSAVGGVLTLVLLLLKPLIRRLMDMNWQYFMWIAVLIVMICPVKINNDVQFPQPISQGIKSVTVRMIPAVSVFEDTTGVYMSDSKLKSVETSLDWLKIASFVWLSVAVALFVKKTVKNAALKKELYGDSKSVGAMGRAQIRESNLVGVPLLMGVFKPFLYIPKGLADTPQMEYVLAHEKTHLKRMDVGIKWISMFVSCVHWFNPFVYVVLRQLDDACEISCDGIVTDEMNDEQKKEYMQMILEASKHEIKFMSSLAAGLSPKGRSVKRRFIEISKKRRYGWFKWAFGVTVMATLLCCTVCAVGLLRGGEVSFQQTEELFLIQPKKPMLHWADADENSITEDKSIAVESQLDTDSVEKARPTGQERFEKAVNQKNVGIITEKRLMTEAVSEQSDIAGKPMNNTVLTPQTTDIERIGDERGELEQEIIAAESLKASSTLEEAEVEQSESQGNNENAKSPVFRGEFNSEGGDTRRIVGVVADENGSVTIGIKSNIQETVDVYISDSDSKKEVHSMGVPVPYEAAYVMEGLEPGKTYDVVMKGEMRNDWNIESEYVIY